MDKNVKLYNAAWHLVYASRLLAGYEEKLSQDLISQASMLTDKIEVNETEIKEIEEYERKLKDIL